MIASHRVSPGEVLEKRFRMVRLIARGGMGEVYEALDVVLGTRVALKTLRVEQASSPRALERFRQEASWRGKSGTPTCAGSSSCTSAARRSHRSSSPWTTSRADARREARARGPLARSCRARDRPAGRGRAHRRACRGCRPSRFEGPERHAGSGGGRGRAGGRHRLRDCPCAGRRRGPPGHLGWTRRDAACHGTGAAHRRCRDAGDGHLRARGAHVQLTTGQLPFAGDTPQEVALERARSPPPEPRRVAAQLSETWSQTTRWCLSTAPAQRPQSPEVVIQALLGERAVGGRWRRSVWAVAALVALAALSPVAWRWRHPGTIPPRPALGVLQAANLTGDTDLNWLSVAMPEAVTARASAHGGREAVAGIAGRGEANLDRRADAGPPGRRGVRLRATPAAHGVARYRVPARPELRAR